VVKWLHANRR